MYSLECDRWSLFNIYTYTCIFLVIVVFSLSLIHYFFFYRSSLKHYYFYLFLLLTFNDFSLFLFIIQHYNFLEKKLGRSVSHVTSAYYAKHSTKLTHLFDGSKYRDPYIRFFLAPRCYTHCFCMFTLNKTNEALRTPYPSFRNSRRSKWCIQMFPINWTLDGKRILNHVLSTKQYVYSPLEISVEGQSIWQRFSRSHSWDLLYESARSSSSISLLMTT